MKKRGIHQPRVITDPICGVIDLGPVLPIIETPEFQALADKRQLGMTSLVFRSATHTRFAHSLGAYQATCALGDRWVLSGFITREERDALAVYALCHDVGHPAFSHTTEDFCRLDDDGMSLELVRGPLRPAIETCGVNFDLVEKLASHENPLSLAVSDKNIGMEKLDYLERDGLFTILSRPPGVEYLRRYIYFVDGQVVIDEKVVEYAIDTQTFYMKMYKGVYFRKSLVIAQRMFHKIVHHLILAGEFSPDDLPGMTDSELLGLMLLSRDPTVREFYGRLRRRELFKEAISVRLRQFAHETRTLNKPIRVVPISQQENDKLVHSESLQKGNHKNLEVLEDEIARRAGLPQGAVLLVPVFNPERFRAQDIIVQGSDEKHHSLRARRPAHFVEMEETARSYSALRICTLEEYRNVLSTPSTANSVVDFIMSSL